MERGCVKCTNKYGEICVWMQREHLLVRKYMWHFSIAIKKLTCCKSSYSIQNMVTVDLHENAANASLACKCTFCVRALNIIPSLGECSFNNIIPIIRIQLTPLRDETLNALLITLIAHWCLMADTHIITNSARVILGYTKIRSRLLPWTSAPTGHRKFPHTQVLHSIS